MTTGFNITPVNLTAGLDTRTDMGSVKAFADTAVTPGVPSKSFAEVVSQTGNDFVQSLQKAEVTSIAGIKGEATTYEVASSVMEAEQALRTTIAIRDRMVQAYLEISRMQI